MVKISFQYPIDLLICFLCSIILLPLGLLNIETTIRIILGLPFILFIPGYTLVFALFPIKKTDHGIDIIERIALSLCLSVAIVPLIGLALNYTAWGIRLNIVLLSLFFFIMSMGVIAIYRWIKTKPGERFTITFNISLPKSESKLDKTLNVILVVFIVIIIILLVYVIIRPKTGEQFTEFYILGSNGMAQNYPTYLNAGENTSVILGLVNHEGQSIHYTIEIWLLNQTTVFNTTAQQNETIYTHMWFIDKITILLNHTPANIEKRWEQQWEYNYTFALNKIGENLKLQFLLFKTPTENFNQNEDYHDLAVEKINTAYRETHFWVSII
jgi:uncharacterized membrane protein